MRTKKPYVVTTLLVSGVLSLLLSGCSTTIQDGLGTLLSPNETYEKEASSKGYEISDDKRLYEQDDDQEVLTMYLTLGFGNKAEGTDHTWSEVNRYPLSYYTENGLEPYKCEAILQVGDEVGPLSGEFGYGELTPNATVQLRGAGASEQIQKSYRVDIKSGKGNWEDQKVVVLNKHAADPTRFRNKLAYDLMAEIPQMFSTRTWFVHLYVKDKSEGEDGLFQDYGLYTAVEQVNGRYLRNRGLDNGGNLYKAETFDWYPHESSITEATSPGFDKAAFENYLEIKGSDDHSRLIELLNAVDNENVLISDVINQYFDEDNLFYWMAFHILTGNLDIEFSNYYLYCPQMVNKWYLISWDNDGIFPDTYERLRNVSYDRSWNHGIFTLVSARLYERMMKDERCRQNLDDAVEDLYQNYLTAEKIRDKTDAYTRLIKSYIYSPPDSRYQRVSEQNYDVVASGIINELDENYETYKRSLAEPWPFHILEPEPSGSDLMLRWEDAYLYPDGVPVYSVELAQSPDFEDCLVNEAGYSGTEYRMSMLPQGEYFLWVRSGDGNGDWQDAYEFYWTEQDTTVYSTMCFYVLEDGTVAVSRYYEE